MPSSPVKAYNSSAYISDIDSTFFADKSDLSSHANYTWDASSIPESRLCKMNRHVT